MQSLSSSLILPKLYSLDVKSIPSGAIGMVVWNGWINNHGSHSVHGTAQRHRIPLTLARFMYVSSRSYEFL